MTKKAVLRSSLLISIRTFFVLFVGVVIWDLLSSAFCVSDCKKFASTITLFSNLYIILPVIFLVNFVLELGIQMLRKRISHGDGRS